MTIPSWDDISETSKYINTLDSRLLDIIQTKDFTLSSLMHFINKERKNKYKIDYLTHQDQINIFLLMF